MRRRVLLLGSAALLLWSAACFSDRAEPLALEPGLDCSLPLDSTRVGNVGVVVIRNFGFQPAQLRVAPGTKVTWINCESGGGGGVGHTTTADAGRWGSPLLQPGQSYTTSIDEPGTYEYHCTPHPSMRGTVIVSAG